MEYTLLFDVGGTGVKAGSIGAGGSFYGGTLTTFDARADRPAGEIFDGFAHMIDQLASCLPTGADIRAVGMAWPGEFDYERGICLIDGLAKYGAIYGMDVREGILDACARRPGAAPIGPGTPFAFLHDVEAFALGECRYGCAKNSHKTLFVCLGTGAGSAFCIDGVAQKQGPGVPEKGWIYNTPFRDSILDDYLSVRGLRAIAQRHTGKQLEGRELYELAKLGDSAALAVFEEFGGVLLEGIGPYLAAFVPDLLVLGGQITGSFPFFGRALQQQCTSDGIVVKTTLQTSRSACLGLFSHLQSVLP